MLVIGIAGPPAGGKSTIASILAELGAAWINADRLAHAALRLAAVKQQLRRAFGEAIFRRDGMIDRKELAKIAFGDDPATGHALQYLESVLHPIVLEMATRRMARLSRMAAFSVTVLDAPLLIEAGWHFHCDELWFVESPLQLRTKWVRSRSWTAEQLRRRESRQLSLREKQRHATHTIDNSGNLQNTKEQIQRHWQRIDRELTFDQRN